MKRRRHRKNPGASVASWAKDHWFLTFLIVTTALYVPVELVRASRRQQLPETTL